jgi:hypothetical protein
MPTSINPFVVFLGLSPGNSPPAHDPAHSICGPYDLPTAGIAHGGLYVPDSRSYWPRVRELGTMIIQAHAPEIGVEQAHALIGQLNLGTGQFGEARNAPFETKYCRWVPDVVLDHLRPRYVILLGLGTRLGQSGTQFDPQRRLNIDWKRPDQRFPFTAYKKSRYEFQLWRRRRPDGKMTLFVQWPQHPSRAPMTNGDLWKESAREFILQMQELNGTIGATDR